MTFDDIKALVGVLPDGAARRRSWWDNDPSGRGHLQARAWLDAGREVEDVDRAARRVRFSAPTWRRGA